MQDTELKPEKTKTGGRTDSRAVRNVFTNWVAYLISGVVSFFLSPFIVHHLGNSAYGVWSLLVSLTGYLGFLDLGIRGAVTRYIARFYSEGSHEESSYTISSACGLFISLGFFSIVASAVFSLVAIPHFKIPAEYMRAAQIVVVITGFNIAISLVSGVFGGVLVGLQRFELTNSIAVVGVVLKAIAIVFALRNGYGLITLAMIQFGATLGELVAGKVLSKNKYPEAILKLTYINRAYVSLIFSFGFFAFVLQLSNYLIYFTDALVIGAFLPVSMVTFFSIGSNLTIYGRDLAGGFSRTMTPLAAQLEVEKGLEGVRRTTLRAGRLCAMTMWPIFITFMIRGGTFIGLWMGPSYVDLSGRVLWILSLPWLFMAPVSVVASVMLGISKHKSVVPAAVMEALANLILSVVLVKRMGILGVAWGTAIPNIASSILFWPWYARRTLKIPIREYFRSLWLVPALGLIPFSACTYAADRLWHANNLASFFGQVMCVALTAIVSIWYLGLTPGERKSYSQRLMLVSGASPKKT